MHTLHCYFKPRAGHGALNGKISKKQIYRTSILYHSSIRDANDAGGARGGKCKQSRDSYVKLTLAQQAQIAKYALASGNKAAILLRYTKEFQTEISYKMSSVSMQRAKYVSELKRYVKK